ncbi:MAG: radical SAM protein [Candidatus Omnitrophota bacterium]
MKKDQEQFRRQKQRAFLHVWPARAFDSGAAEVEVPDKDESLFVKLSFGSGGRSCRLSRDADGLLIENVPMLPSYRYDHKLLKIFDQIFRTYRPPLIHIHAFSGMNILPVLNVASSFHAKKIVTLHDNSFYCVKNGKPVRQKCGVNSLLDCGCSFCRQQAKSNNLNLRDFNQLRTALCERIILQTDKVICSSEDQRCRLLEWFGGRDKFVVLPSGAHESAKKISQIYDKALASRSGGLFLRLGRICNNQCVYCVTGLNYTNESFDFDYIRNVLKKNRNRYDSLVLTGGEPTIRKDFLQILDFAYKSGYAMLLQTNARLLALEKFCEKVSQYNLKFSININGPTAKIHDAVSRVPGSFRQTVQGIKNLQKHDARILVKILLTKDNHRHLLRTAKFVAKLGVKKICIVFLTPFGSARDNFQQVVPSYSEVSVPLKQTLEWLKKTPQIRASIEGFPHCCLDQEFHPLITETRMGFKSLNGLIPENGRLIYNCKTERVFNQKQKFPDCGDCLYDKQCEGVYREYLHHAGRDEFKPVLKDKYP